MRLICTIHTTRITRENSLAHRVQSDVCHCGQGVIHGIQRAAGLSIRFCDASGVEPQSCTRYHVMSKASCTGSTHTHKHADEYLRTIAALYSQVNNSNGLQLTSCSVLSPSTLTI